MATAQDVRTFFGLIGKTVSGRHLLRFQDYLVTQRYGKNEDGTARSPTADDVIDFLYRITKARTNSFVRGEASRAARPDSADIMEN